MSRLNRKALIGALITLAASAASAGPAYTTDIGKDILSAREALKLAKSGKVIYKCQRAQVSPSGGIAKTKRAKTQFVASVKHSDEALDTIENGGKGYKCQPLEYDTDRKRLANADVDGEDT